MQIDGEMDSQHKQELTAADFEMLDNGGLQVLYALIGNPATAEQVSIRTGLGRAKIKYFIDRLIESNLASLYKTVRKESEIDLYYKAVSDKISLELLGTESKEEMLVITHAILSSLQTSLLGLFSGTKTQTEEQSTQVLLVHQQCRMPSDKAEMFMEKFNDLTRQFAQEEDVTCNDEFALTLAMYKVTGSITEPDADLTPRRGPGVMPVLN